LFKSPPSEQRSPRAFAGLIRPWAQADRLRECVILFPDCLVQGEAKRAAHRRAEHAGRRSALWFGYFTSHLGPVLAAELVAGRTGWRCGAGVDSRRKAAMPRRGGMPARRRAMASPQGSDAEKALPDLGDWGYGRSGDQRRGKADQRVKLRVRAADSSEHCVVWAVSGEVLGRLSGSSGRSMMCDDDRKPWRTRLCSQHGDLWVWDG